MASARSEPAPYRVTWYSGDGRRVVEYYEDRIAAVERYVELKKPYPHSSVTVERAGNWENVLR